MIPGEHEMPESIEVARLDQIPPGSGARFTLVGKGVAVFNVDGTNLRHRRHLPSRRRLTRFGKLNGSTVTCPVHGMKFDVTTGCFSGTSESPGAPFMTVPSS